MKTTTCHFSIDFNWLTDRVRTFWSEGEYKRAYDVLKCCDLEGEKANDIIRGKLKMVAAEDNPELGTLIEDNWKPDLSYCENGLYPDPDDIATMAQKSIKQEVELNRLNKIKEEGQIEELKKLVDDLEYYSKNSLFKDYEETFDLIDLFPANIKAQVDIPFSDCAS